MKYFDKKTAVTLLPNMISMFNLFCGFLSLVMVARGQVALAVWLVVLALVWDSIDGNIARMFKVSTSLGRELDSLSDMMSFVVAPAFLAGIVMLETMNCGIFLALFLYLGCGTYRLARFNARPTLTPHFQGLPSPAAATVLVLFILNAIRQGWGGEHLFSFFVILVMTGLSFLMVSGITYPKFSAIPYSQWQFLFYLAAGMFFLGAAFGLPEAGLLAGMILFLATPALLNHALHSAHADEEHPVPKVPRF